MSHRGPDQYHGQLTEAMPEPMAPRPIQATTGLVFDDIAAVCVGVWVVKRRGYEEAELLTTTTTFKE